MRVERPLRSKRAKIDLDLELAPEKAYQRLKIKDLSKRTKFTIYGTIIASAILAAAGIVIDRFGWLGEVPATEILFLAQLGLCLLALLSVALKGLKRETQYRDTMREIMHKAAEGKYDKIKTDDETSPIDKATLDDIARVLDELRESERNNSELSGICEGLREDRDDYQFRMIGARMVPGMIERAIRKIGRVAETRKINDIALFADNLCALMGSSLQTAKKPVSLANELNLIKTYLDLNDAITGKKTEYRMSVTGSIVGYKVIPHLILPVVENFFEHSDRGRNAKYELTVEIASNPNNMLIIIHDNGSGIDVDTLEKVQNEISENEIDTDGDALSLSSINRRIGLCYGEKYGLHVTSSKLGTNVRIVLPAKPDLLREDQ